MGLTDRESAIQLLRVRITQRGLLRLLQPYLRHLARLLCYTVPSRSLPVIVFSCGSQEYTILALPTSAPDYIYICALTRQPPYQPAHWPQLREQLGMCPLAAIGVSHYIPCHYGRKVSYTSYLMLCYCSRQSFQSSHACR